MKQINEIYLLKSVSLEEIFDSNEIDEILKENILNTDFENKSISRFKKHSINFDRSSLVMKFLSIAIDKLKTVNKVVAKGLDWVKTEIQDKLVTKDAYLKPEWEQTLEIKNIMSWIDDSQCYNDLANNSAIKRKAFSPVGIKSKTTTVLEQTQENYKHRNSLHVFDMFKFNLRKQSPTISKYVEGTHKCKQELNTIDQSPKIRANNATMNEFFESREEIRKASKSKLRKLNTLTNCSDIIDSDHFTLKKKRFLNLGDILIVDEEVPESVNSKGFDIFSFENEVGRINVLPFITCEIFFNYDLYSVIHLHSMEKFTESIRDGYSKVNPFHNDLHASDVLQTCYSIINFSNVTDVLQLDSLDLSGFFIAAMIHDFKHPGVTNGFLINTKSDIAVNYNGKFVFLI